MYVYEYGRVYIYIHTCIHGILLKMTPTRPYIHKYIHAYMHTQEIVVNAYIHTCMHAYKYTYTHTYTQNIVENDPNAPIYFKEAVANFPQCAPILQAYGEYLDETLGDKVSIHTHTHTYTHTYIHTHIHTYKYTHMCVWRVPG
jgi:hypothetical protein